MFCVSADIDECESSPCAGTDATCEDEINGYHCYCPGKNILLKCYGLNASVINIIQLAINNDHISRPSLLCKSLVAARGTLYYH